MIATLVCVLFAFVFAHEVRCFAGEDAEEEASEQRERKTAQAHVREPQCGIDMHPRVHVEAAEEPRQ